MRVFAIILAAGRGERFGADKVLQDLGGKPVWKWSYDLFRSCPHVTGVGIVCSSKNLDSIHALASDADFVIGGGENRQESCRRGVAAVPSPFDAILIHDGARPFVTAEIVERVLAGISEVGAAAAATSSTDTLRMDGTLIDRDHVVAMQTPQGATRKSLAAAHGTAEQLFTDDMALLEANGQAVKLVEGDPANFKITTAYDLERARSMVNTMETRTGLGYDVHKFSTDASRPLMLGGVRFEGCPALEGHSDADVIIHAAVDALLGAAALGDIGQHFPPTDMRWKDEPSTTFLKHASSLLVEGGWRIVNLDIAVIAETPRIMRQALEMRTAMANALGISVDRVSVKATTNEGLGSIGRKEGIAAYATATISK